jgi:fructose-1,6-bisphosphatase II
MLVTNVRPTRNLALDLVRVTEAAALSAGRYMGRGDKNAADSATAEGIHLLLNSIQMDGVIVIGEGEKGVAPILFNGEKLGTGEPPLVDIAIEPIDGTRPMALGMGNSITTVAMTPRGAMFNPGHNVYMEKIAVGPQARDAIDIDASIAENLNNVARAKGKDVKDLAVVILDRARHKELITEVRRCGSRIRLIPDGDIAGALMTCLPESGIDLLMGTGGSAEGVLAACALRCIGGNMQVKLISPDPEELDRSSAPYIDYNRVLHLEDLVSSEDVFFAATGITNGDLLRGVNYFADVATTDSLVMRGLTGTIRRITATHQLSKLNLISSLEF